MIYQESRKQIYAKYAHRWPKSKKEEAEFGPGKKEFIVCPECENVYFDKSWKHSLMQKSKIKIQNDNAKLKNIKFQICSACQMIKEKKFEGQVILENAPEKFRRDILNAIENMGKQAYNNDPQDRIIEIRNPKFEIRNSIEILTTENQLAVRIAKKISQTFGGKVEIQHSKEGVSRTKIIWV